MTYSQFCLYLSRNIQFRLLCHLVAYCLLYREVKPKSSNPEYELHAKKQNQKTKKTKHTHHLQANERKLLMGWIVFPLAFTYASPTSFIWNVGRTCQTDLGDGLWIKWKRKPSETLLYDRSLITKCRMWPGVRCIKVQESLGRHCSINCNSINKY